jgi:hypothetical protein
MRSAAMVYHPVIGFFVHSVTHSTFMLSRSCQWSFAIVVVSVALLLSHPLCRSLLRPCVLGPKILLCLPLCVGKPKPLPILLPILYSRRSQNAYQIKKNHSITGHMRQIMSRPSNEANQRLQNTRSLSLAASLRIYICPELSFHRNQSNRSNYDERINISNIMSHRERLLPFLQTSVISVGSILVSRLKEKSGVYSKWLEGNRKSSNIVY